jgi:hypothetical protein
LGIQVLGNLHSRAAIDGMDFPPLVRAIGILHADGKLQDVPRWRLTGFGGHEWVSPYPAHDAIGVCDVDICDAESSDRDLIGRQADFWAFFGLSFAA